MDFTTEKRSVVGHSLGSKGGIYMCGICSGKKRGRFRHLRIASVKIIVKQGKDSVLMIMIVVWRAKYDKIQGSQDSSY